MFGLYGTVAGLNVINLNYHQSVVERQPNLVLKISYMKDLEDVDPFNISGSDGGKESEHGKGGVDANELVT